MPGALDEKYSGPFEIINRPSNTTVTLLVGYYKDNTPRTEVHHWSRLQLAHLRPDAGPASRHVLGRPRQNSTESVNNFQPPNSNYQQNTQPTYSQLNANNNNHLVTQPRLPSVATHLQPAELADMGRNNNVPLSPTGPPPVVAFPPTNREISSGHNPEELSTGAGRGESVSSTPPGRWQPSPPRPDPTPSAWPSPSESRTPQPSSNPQLDHDYYRQPGPLTDHTYFQTPPAYQPVLPPPGFENYHQGRPSRQTKVPKKYQDFVLE